jgi:hypothetical protein
MPAAMENSPLKAPSDPPNGSDPDAGNHMPAHVAGSGVLDRLVETAADFRNTGQRLR